MNYPKISIITPNLNQEKYLEQTILSVITQDYPNLEYIIIDGGSTDNSVEIIKKYANYLTYWISEKDNGMYDAIQKGFDCSTGEIMAWINSDDMYHKNAFFIVSEIFSTFPEVNWLVGASTGYDESGRTVYVSQTRRFTKFDFYNHDYKWLLQESVFWRRSLWNKSGGQIYPPELKYAGDFALWLNFFSFEKLHVTHSLIGGFRWRQSNQISLDHYSDYINEVESILSSFKLLKRDFNILQRYKKVLYFERILNELRLFRRGWIENKYRTKYFQTGYYITFDRYIGKFKITD